MDSVQTQPTINADAQAERAPAAPAPSASAFVPEATPGSAVLTLGDLVRAAFEHHAADIHLQGGARPHLRIGGRLQPFGEPWADGAVYDLIATIAPVEKRGNLRQQLVAGLDFSYVIEGTCRFRCSAFSHQGHCGMVLRLVPDEIPALEALHLPRIIQDITLSRRGLVIVSGTTGSGKTSTVAAMVDLINQSQAAKIVTIEDPIEYVHTPQRALLTQIEVGSDTPWFSQAVRQALRQDPDVLMIGELRDVETLRLALRAADAGHQVFATMHAANAPQTLERMIALFPPVEHKLLLWQLATALEAIIVQRLLVTTNGQRRPAIEIMRGTRVTERLILENRLDELPAYMETGEAGMQTFDQHLLRLYADGTISGTEALHRATLPEALSLRLDRAPEASRPEE